MNSILSCILYDLRKGSLISTYQNIYILNDFAQKFYNMGRNKVQPTEEDKQNMSDLLRICNILYNCAQFTEA